MDLALPTEKEMLQAVMRRAYGNNRDYKGEGDRWCWMPKELDDALESKAYIRVLQSEAFCRELWRFRMVAQTIPPGTPLSKLIPTEIRTDFETHWRQHHKALQTEVNPIEYCYLHMNSIRGER